MRNVLRNIKRMLAVVSKRVIVSTPMPLPLQTWVIKWLLPMDPWPKSLVYQQCLANRVIKSNGAIAQSGPFKGMVCIRNADEGCLVPKLLGCYEEELIPTVENFIRTGYDCIIDVGCASGYWLTGLALRMPHAKAFGFDIDEEALARCSELIALNNVQSRVKLLGLCTPDQLEELIDAKTLLFMDCDGPEYDLLDPRLTPALRRADIIVEIHDFINPKISSTLLERFRESHAIERISSGRREPASERYPGLKALPPEHWPAALDERRPCVQEWMIMRSRVLNPQTEVSSAAGTALS